VAVASEHLRRDGLPLTRGRPSRRPLLQAIHREELENSMTTTETLIQADDFTQTDNFIPRRPGTAAHNADAYREQLRDIGVVMWLERREQVLS
jgi:hypothetical protein